MFYSSYRLCEDGFHFSFYIVIIMSSSGLGVGKLENLFLNDNLFSTSLLTDNSFIISF